MINKDKWKKWGREEGGGREEEKAIKGCGGNIEDRGVEGMKWELRIWNRVQLGNIHSKLPMEGFYAYVLFFWGSSGYLWSNLTSHWLLRGYRQSGNPDVKKKVTKEPWNSTPSCIWGKRTEDKWCDFSKRRQLLRARRWVRLAKPSAPSLQPPNLPRNSRLKDLVRAENGSAQR